MEDISLLSSLPMFASPPAAQNGRQGEPRFTLRGLTDSYGIVAVGDPTAAAVLQRVRAAARNGGQDPDKLPRVNMQRLVARLDEVRAASKPYRFPRSKDTPPHREELPKAALPGGDREPTHTCSSPSQDAPSSRVHHADSSATIRRPLTDYVPLDEALERVAQVGVLRAFWLNPLHPTGYRMTLKLDHDTLGRVYRTGNLAAANDAGLVIVKWVRKGYWTRDKF